jgi:hypothetical protein
MEVPNAYLADAARVENGKLFVLGAGITILYRTEFPAAPDVVVVFTLRHHAAEVGRTRRLRLSIHNADGAQVGDTLEAEMIPQGLPPGMPSGCPMESPFVFGLGGPIFPGPGMYEVQILIDDNPARSIPFVVAPPAMAQAA